MIQNYNEKKGCFCYDASRMKHHSTREEGA